jgi:hypothetical protein
VRKQLDRRRGACKKDKGAASEKGRKRKRIAVAGTGASVGIGGAQ